MSRRVRERKQEFLAQHPLCCFCAGDRRSEEVDHVPGRVFFRNRSWPEGYEFPACAECNRATSLDEKVMGLVARMNTNAETEEDHQELAKLVRAVRNNHPGLLESMSPTIRELRNARAKYGLEPSPGEPITALPVLSLSSPRIKTAARNFSRKLFSALFYKHTGQILSHMGGIGGSWYSNLTAHSIPQDILTFVPEIPVLERNARPLNDQFFYRWGVTETKTLAAFIVTFNQSLVFLGGVRQDANPTNTPEGTDVLRPYTRTQSHTTVSRDP